MIDLSNEAYHADLSALSSSSLKMLLKDPAAFKAQYIDGLKTEQPYKAVFEDGTLTHCLVLEPELVSQYAIFPGLRKAGKLWEQFKLDNPGKICISIAQMMKAEKLYKAHAALDVAVKLVSEGLPEHNMRGKLHGLAVKARADYIVPKKYIVDVKTTSMPSDVDVFKQTVLDYGYHLSAALYVDIAEQVYGYKHDFYWEVLSKIDNQCHIYKASEATLYEGRNLVNQALLLYKHCAKTGIWSLGQPPEDRSSKLYEIVEV
jgi:exodeoxyribonuclease VIII